MKYLLALLILLLLLTPTNPPQYECVRGTIDSIDKNMRIEFIDLETPYQDSVKIEWFERLFNYEYLLGSGDGWLRLGLREDGVVVWRKK